MNINTQDRTLTIYTSVVDMVAEELEDINRYVRLAAAYNVGVTIKQFVGPGGGNPEMALWSTSRADLARFLAEHGAADRMKTLKIAQRKKAVQPANHCIYSDS